MSLAYENITQKAGGPYIRLLHLRPPLENRSLIEASLTVVPLHAKPKFEALSYVWGTMARKHRMTCDGSTVEITENLFSALTHLRHNDTTRILWVDAVCINQRDNAEKSDQVARMGPIYRAATTVLVWLGPAGQMSDVAFQFINAVFDQLRRSEPGTLQKFIDHDEYAQKGVDFAAIRTRFEREATTAESTLGAADTPNTNKPGYEDILTMTNKSDDEFVYALSWIMRRPWWTRVWIIQELCLAPEVVLCCGNSSVPWEAFGFGGALTKAMVTRGRLSKYFALATVRLELRASTVQPSLFLALSAFRWFRATYPHDKVYALLGLTGDTGIQPDYTISYGDCYRQVARAILSTSQALDLLDFVVPPSSSKTRKVDIPSWVPDWNYDVEALDKNFESPQAFSSASPLSVGSSRDAKQESELLTGNVSFIDDNLLTLRGKVFDRIEYLEGIIYVPNGDFVTYHPPLDFPDSWYDGWRYVDVARMLVIGLYQIGGSFRTIERLAKFAEKVDSSPGALTHDRSQRLCQLFEAFRMDDIPNDVDEERKSADKVYELKDRLVKSTIYRIARFIGLHWIAPPLYQVLLAFLWFSFEDDNDDEWKMGNNWMDIMRQCADQRPAITRSSRRLCVVPHTSRVGDRISLLRGGRHPYVVRPATDLGRWQIVGPCYVGRQYMNNLKQAWREEDLQEMEFQ